MDLLIKNTQFFTSKNTLVDGLELCELLVSYFDVSIRCLDSFWWHPFTAEDPLVSKLCNAKFLQICSDEETNSSHLYYKTPIQKIWLNPDEVRSL